MFENLAVFRTAYAMARHAGARQQVVAQNMANADTPGFRAKDVTPFSAFIAQQGQDRFAAHQTRPLHILGSRADRLTTPRMIADDGPINPNGNSVSLETEMLKAVDVKRQHDRAITIYKSALGILRSSLGRS